MMNSIKYKKVILCILVFVHTAAYSQLDPLNYQYLSNQSMINPAYVGVHNMALALASTRAQWVGIEGAPWTHTLSMSSAINEQMGAGLLVISDNYGINNNIESILSYSYKITGITHSISFGIQGGLAQNKINYSSLNQEAFDPSIPTANTSIGVSNYGVGVFLKHDRYYVGLSVPRILKVNLAEEGTPEIRYNRHYYFSAGYVFDYIQLIKIKPSILIRAVEGESVSIDLNGQIIFNDQLWLGLSLRNLNAISFNIQYIEGYARFGYVFELSTGPLASASYGTHELMVSLDFNFLKNHELKKRYF